MINDRDILNEQINAIMEKKRYTGNLREFEGIVKKILMYGVVAPFLGGGLAWPVSAALMFIYRNWTDKCIQRCGNDKQCYNKCYYLEAKKIRKMIEKDLKDLNKIKDPKKRAKVEKKLRKELELWKTRERKWKEKIID